MILLDTHSLLWVLAGSDSLGPVARASLVSAPAVYSSPISVVEIRIKALLGRLDVPDDLVRVARESGIRELPYRHADADALAAFPQLARHDPFNRILVAQAAATEMTLLTADRALLDLGRPLVQDARE